MSAQTAPSERTQHHQPEDRLETALDRLRHATDALDAALSRQEREKRAVAVLEQELEVLLNDRSKLAHELDQVKARASRLDAAGAEVSGRVDALMSSLQSMLARI
jgi:predicted  nucleic acid-binding Zn-ribbon protein